MSGSAQDAGSTLRNQPVTCEPASGERRSFLGALLALGSVCVGALLSVPLIRFALFPLLRRTTELKESPVGKVSEFSSLSEPYCEPFRSSKWMAGARPFLKKWFM